MSDETTTEQLAEIEGQAADTPATEYTPPEGWRVLAVGERLRDGDVTVCRDGSQYPADRLGGWVGSNQRYIRPIEPVPQPEPQPEPQPVSDADQQIRLLAQANHNHVAMIGRLQSRINDLETINDAQEKYARLAGQENTDLQHRLNVVSAEWAEQAGTINGLRAHVEAVEADVVQQRLERNRYQNQVLRLTAELDNKTTECRNLQIELDALQQAPQAETMAATPPATEDRFEEGWDAGAAWAVETIAEWTETFRTCGSQGLSYHVMQNLPHIMRTLTGLTPED